MDCIFQSLRTRKRRKELDALQHSTCVSKLMCHGASSQKDLKFCQACMSCIVIETILGVILKQSRASMSELVPQANNDATLKQGHDGGCQGLQMPQDR